MFGLSSKVKTYVDRSFDMLTCYVVIEPISKIMTGIVNGLGKQGLASVFTLIGYWVVGIPLTLVYVYLHDGGLFGIWLGATVSLIFIFICQYFIVHSTDYE